MRLQRPYCGLGRLVFCRCGFNFHKSSLILTPELKTSALWVPALQLAIAAPMVFRRTNCVGALGIVVLYVYATRVYRRFHMLDYPIFLGIAAFLASESIYGSEQRALMFTIFWVTTGVTFLWGGLNSGFIRLARMAYLSTICRQL
jgi:hypothetical protein